MDYVSIMRGLLLGNVYIMYGCCVAYGLCEDDAWIMHVCIDYVWCFMGYAGIMERVCMHYAWIEHRLCMDYAGIMHV